MLEAQKEQKHEDLNMIVISGQAERELEALPEAEQVRISRAIAEVYHKITTFLVVASAQSFLSREQSFQLNYLTNSIQTVVAAGYPVKVQICSQSYVWTILGVGDPDALSSFNVVKLV